MSLLFKRRAEQEIIPEEAPPIPHAVGYIAVAESCHDSRETEVIDHHEIVASYEPQLTDSAALWRGVASTAQNFSSLKWVRTIQGGLEEIYELDGLTDLHQEDKDTDTRAIAGSFSVYSLMAARSLAETGFTITPTWLIKSVYASADKNVPFLIKREGKQTYDFTKNVMTMADLMKDADIASEEVLAGLVSAYRQRPMDLALLATHYRNASGNETPLYKELRKIISADWHDEDQTQSITRAFCQEVRSNPEVFADGFVGEVEKSKEHNERYKRIWDHAEFAKDALKRITIARDGGQLPDAAEILRRLYPDWSDFDDISTHFARHADAQMRIVEKAFADIAGPSNRDTMRARVGEQAFQEFAQEFALPIGRTSVTLNRDDRRRLGIKNGNSVKRGPNLKSPTLEDIQEAATPETEREPLKLQQLKSGMHGSAISSETTIEELVHSFGKNKGRNYEQDVASMLARLQVEPLSRATVRLRAAKPCTLADGNTVNMWRFAPNDAQNLPISKENRYLRIVFGATESSLFIADILTHGDFDNKYRG